MIRRTVTRAGAVILVSTLIGMSSCVLYSFYVRWQAEKCLATIRRFTVGSSTAADVREAMRPFRRFEADGTAISEKGQLTYTYRFENKGVHLLGIFRPALFQTGLRFRDGVVVEKGAGFLAEPFLAVNTRESIAGLKQNPSLDEDASGMIVGVYDPPTKMDVFLDTRASKARQKDAYEYNLSCFTIPLGCRSVYEILPGVK